MLRKGYSFRLPYISCYLLFVFVTCGVLLYLHTLTPEGEPNIPAKHLNPCRVILITHVVGFRESSVAATKADIIVASSNEGCFSFCAERGLALAVVQENFMCRCGNSIHPALAEYLSGFHKHDSTPSEKIYYITKECQTESQMKMNDLNIYRIGCFLYTKAAESALQDLKVSDESLPEFCVKTCETKNYPVAITGSSSGCFCVNTQSLYQATLIIMSTICFAPVRHLTAWRTRSSDPFCESKNFFEKSRHNIVGLVSFPGSGNSWLRQMLEMVTGIYTGSVYHDKNLHNTGLLGELLDWASGKTLLVKDHLYPDKQETLERYSAIVLLIRNPYHALVAEFNRRKSQSHTGHANYSLFWSEDWSSYALSMVDLWKDSISLVLRRRTVTKLVFYEDLARDQEYEVRNIVNFLNFTKTPYFQRLFCLRTHKAELFKRESKFVQPFSTGLTNHINQAIKEIRVLLMNFGGKSWKSLPPYERESSDPDALIIRHGVARSEGIATKEARIKRRSGL